MRITLQPRLFRAARALLASCESRSASSASAIAVRSRVPASALAWSLGPVPAGIGARRRREPDAGWVHSRERRQQRALPGTGAAEDREDAAGRQPNPMRPEFVSADPDEQRGRRDRDVRGRRHRLRAKAAGGGIRLAPARGCRIGPAPRPRVTNAGSASTRKGRSRDGSACGGSARPRPSVRTVGPRDRSPKEPAQRGRTRPRGRGPAPTPEAAATPGGPLRWSPRERRSGWAGRRKTWRSRVRARRRR